MKKHIEMLDWRGENFRFARTLLGMSISDVLYFTDGTCRMEDIEECEYIDSWLPMKIKLMYIYNELLIGRDIDYRLHSSYVNYRKMPQKSKV